MRFTQATSIIDHQIGARTVTCTVCDKPHVYMSRADFERVSGSTVLCADCRLRIRTLKSPLSTAAGPTPTYRQVYQACHLRASDAVPPLIHPERLSLKQVVWYLSLMGAGVTDDYAHIPPWRTFLPTPPLTPTIAYGEELFLGLAAASLIVVCPKSPIQPVLNLQPDGFPFVMHDVHWHPRVGIREGAFHAAIAQLQEWLAIGYWKPHWEREWRMLGQEIMIDECWAYLTYLLRTHGVDEKLPAKTFATLEYGLTLFAANQLFRLIWRTVKYLMDMRQQKAMTDLHVINSVPGSLQRTITLAHDQRWQIYGYDRPAALPRSIVSTVFFNQVLHHRDDSGLMLTPAQWSRPPILPYVVRVNARKTSDLPADPTTPAPSAPKRKKPQK